MDTIASVCAAVLAFGPVITQLLLGATAGALLCRWFTARDSGAAAAAEPQDQVDRDRASRGGPQGFKSCWCLWPGMPPLNGHMANAANGLDCGHDTSAAATDMSKVQHYQWAHFDDPAPHG